MARQTAAGGGAPGPPKGEPSKVPPPPLPTNDSTVGSEPAAEEGAAVAVGPLAALLEPESDELFAAYGLTDSTVRPTSAAHSDYFK